MENKIGQMITRPTVFVLGAGASYGFGFPLGNRLKEIIIENFDPITSEKVIELFTGLGFSGEQISSFRNQLRLSPSISVDSFLEHRGDEDRDLGKLAIAYALIPLEKTDLLFNISSWYNILFNKIKSTFADFEKNRISFITFNYDRSLEHFLMTALVNQFNKPEQEVAEKLNKIPIIHLYGKLGKLPWETTKGDEFSREYKPQISQYLLRRSSKSLKIIYDKFELDNEDFKQARKLLSNARRIYFLGFGYHTDNLDRLKIKLLSSNTTGYSSITTTPTVSRRIEGTSFKLPQDLKERIPKIYKIRFPNHDWDINEFFEQKIRLD